MEKECERDDHAYYVNNKLLLPLVDLSQERFEHLLNGETWLSFNGRDQMLIALALILKKHALMSKKEGGDDKRMDYYLCSQVNMMKPV